MNKYWRRAVKRRVAYERYKRVLNAAKISPTEAVKAAFQLIEEYKGHHRHHIAMAAQDTVKYLIEEDEYNKVMEAPKEELPLLIDNLQYSSSKELLVTRLKEE